MDVQAARSTIIDAPRERQGQLVGTAERRACRRGAGGLLPRRERYSPSGGTSDHVSAQLETSCDLCVYVSDGGAFQ